MTRDVFVAAQIACTMMLLTGAGLLATSFWRLTQLDPGFDLDHVITAQLELPSTDYPDSARQAAFARDLLFRLRRVPGVNAAAVSTGSPFAGGEISSVRVPGDAGTNGPPAWIVSFTEDFLRVLGIPLVRGQSLRGDGTDHPNAVLIDQAAARLYFRGADPIGRRLVFDRRKMGSVTGIVGDSRQDALREPPPPHIYQLLASAPSPFLAVFVRTERDPAALHSLLEEAIRKTGATVPIDRVSTMRELASSSLVGERFYALLLAIFAASSLAIAAFGVYAIVRHAVAARTHEIGLRMALGAQVRRVVFLIVGREMKLAFVGIVFGTVGALATTRLLTTLLFEVTPASPSVLVAVAGLLSAVAFVACYVPARAAARVDPLASLRSE